MKEIKLKHIDQVLYYEVIDNGLSVYMLVNKNAKDFVMSFTAKYGSIHTEFKINGEYHRVSDGIAHFLEHANFNIDDNTTAHELFSDLGSTINAFTSFEQTTYWVESNCRFKKNLNLLLDYVQKGFFTKKNIEKEKGIIVEEVRRSANNVDTKLYYEANKALYQKYKYSVPILGTEDDVRGITLDEVNLVHSNFYRPDNMFVVITGNFKPEEAIKIIKDNQKNKSFSNNKVEIIKEKEPLEVKEKYKVINDKQVEIPRIEIGYKLDRKDFANYDDKELDSIFYVILNSNFGITSDFREMLEKEELISFMSFNCIVLDDVVTIRFSVYSNRIEDVKEAFAKKMKDIKVTKMDLERNKRVHIANLINDYDYISRVNREIGYSIIYYNRIYDNLYTMYNSISLVKVNDVISKINTNNEAIVILDK